MRIQSITLLHFRNLNGVTFYFNPYLTLIIGKNSVGKTNLLEAIYTVMSGNGIRDVKTEELIEIGKNMGSIECEFREGDDKITAKIILDNKERFTKRFFINKIEKKLYQYCATLPPVVIFSPEHIEDITTEPSRRRTLFDKIISFYDIEYRKRLAMYLTGLTKRNKLLERPMEERALKKELSFWNMYLEEQAQYIKAKREELIAFLNAHPKLDSFEFSIVYHANELTKTRLEQTLSEQIQRRTTHIGPQRDDYRIFLKKNGKDTDIFDVLTYGSRSQQRLALLWIIINELLLFEERLEKHPILLLDDIFSELDELNRLLVIDMIKKYQTVITATRLSLVKKIDIPYGIIEL